MTSNCQAANQINRQVPTVYQARRPEKTAFYQIVQRYFESWLLANGFAMECRIMKIMIKASVGDEERAVILVLQLQKLL